MGRKPSPIPMVELRFTVPKPLSDGLNEITRLGDFTKSTYVRTSLLDLLVQFGVLYPEVAEIITPTAKLGYAALHERSEPTNAHP